jgi:hypothetical protein
MNNLFRNFIIIPGNYTQCQVIRWLLKKFKFYNIFIIGLAGLLLAVAGIWIPSLLNFFSFVLTILLILCLNASYLLSVLSIFLLYRKNNGQVSNRYIVRNTFNINLIFSSLAIIAFMAVLVISKLQ